MEYVACNLCGSRDSKVLYPSTMPEGTTAEDIEHFRCTSASYGKHHAIVKCRNCGLVYVNPHRNAATILHNYEEVVDDLYVEEREGRVLTFQRNLRPLEELMPPAPRPEVVGRGLSPRGSPGDRSGVRVGGLGGRALALGSQRGSEQGLAGDRGHLRPCALS